MIQYRYSLVPVQHELFPLNNKCIWQVAYEVQDSGTCRGKICSTEEDTEHEALRYRGDGEYDQKDEHDETI